MLEKAQVWVSRVYTHTHTYIYIYCGCMHYLRMCIDRVLWMYIMCGQRDMVAEDTEQNMLCKLSDKCNCLFPMPLYMANVHQTRTRPETGYMLKACLDTQHAQTHTLTHIPYCSSNGSDTSDNKRQTFRHRHHDRQRDSVPLTL